MKQGSYYTPLLVSSKLTVRVICKHSVFANYWNLSSVAPPPDPLPVHAVHPDSSRKRHPIACEATELLSSALIIGEMDGTENGELVPLLPLWSVLPAPFLSFLPSFFEPHPHSKAIFSILFWFPVLWRIHSLALKPVTLLLISIFPSLASSLASSCKKS